MRVKQKRNYSAQFALYFVSVQHIRWIAVLQHWIPAFAGMTHPFRYPVLFDDCAE